MCNKSKRVILPSIRSPSTPGEPNPVYAASDRLAQREESPIDMELRKNRLLNRNTVLFQFIDRLKREIRAAYLFCGFYSQSSSLSASKGVGSAGVPVVPGVEVVCLHERHEDSLATKLCPQNAGSLDLQTERGSTRLRRLETVSHATPSLCLLLKARLPQPS